MSSIPVKRTTTRVTRSAKDAENINARPSRLTSRAKSALAAGGGASTAVAATAAVSTRATASTAASKAKSVASTTTTEAAGAKRKREVLVEVTGLVTNHKGRSTGTAAGLKGKEKETAGNTTATTTKTAKTAVKPSVKPGGVALRRVLRSASQSTTTSNSKTDTDGTALEHDEKMEIDDPLDVPPPPPVTSKRLSRAVGEEDLERVFKRRHTEKEELEALDESQVEADKVAADLVEEIVAPSVQMWDDLDAEDWDDPVMVSEYVVDVCIYLKQVELAMLPNPNYMDKQGEITWEHRGILIDWLLQVHAKFGLMSESLFLTVNVLDRFLGLRTIAITKLQLVGLAAFLVATKFEETYAPSVKEIAYLANNQYTVEEILKAEKYILKMLEWDLKAPGPMGWLRRASKADGCEVQARTIAKYLLEVGCLERKLIGVVPSKVSAAALWLARLALGRDEWVSEDFVLTDSETSEEELLPVADLMVEYMITTPIPHDSLFKKYAHKRYFRCSSYMIQWSLARWPENGQVDFSRDLAHVKEEIVKDRELEAQDDATE